MTLAEIRERYGVPAEVVMRVGFGSTSKNTLLRASKTFPGRVVIYCPFDGCTTCVKPRDLTYYNDDGDVIWRPETAKS